jgi:hypothetical protein
MQTINNSKFQLLTFYYKYYKKGCIIYPKGEEKLGAPCLRNLQELRGWVFQ